MLQFTTLDKFTVTGRGVGHVVVNPAEKREDALIRDLIGSTVLLDGVPRKVLTMEWFTPGKIVKAGETIVIVV